jgi:hypothetical protein
VSDAETVEAHELPCCVCRQPVHYSSATTPHPESPQMFKPPPGAWVGVIDDPDDDDGLQLIFVCSDACRSRLLSE